MTNQEELEVRQAIGLTFKIHDHENPIEDLKVHYLLPKSAHMPWKPIPTENVVEIPMDYSHIRAGGRMGFLTTYHAIYMYVYNAYLKQNEVHKELENSNGFN